MARGTLYQFQTLQKLQELGYDNLSDFLAAAKTGNPATFPGKPSDLTDFAENVQSEFMSADAASFGYEFEWCELWCNPTTELESFADWIREADGEAYVLHDVLLFKLSSMAKMRMLKPAYKRFMQESKELSLEQFATTDLWTLRDSINSTYGEAALVDEIFYPIEQAIRELPADEWIVSARPILMH